MYKFMKLLIISILLSIIYLNSNFYQKPIKRKLITMSEYNDSCISFNNTNYLIQYIGNLSNKAFDYLDYSENISLWDANNSSVINIKTAIYCKLYKNSG